MSTGTVLCKSLEQSPRVFIFFLGKLEIDIEIYQSIHKYENILKGKNRVCKIIMSLKVNI